MSKYSILYYARLAIDEIRVKLRGARGKWGASGSTGRQTSAIGISGRGSQAPGRIGDLEPGWHAWSSGSARRGRPWGNKKALPRWQGL